MNLILANTGVAFPNLGIYFENLPKTINVFGTDVAVYGCTMALGMLFGLVMVCIMARVTKQDVEQYIDMAIYAILAGLIGARIYYVVFSWDYYSENLTEIFNFRAGGMAFYGSLIGGVLACLIYCRVRKKSFLLMADTASYGMITGQIIGRWGNFFNREAFGQVALDSNPFAMRIYFDDNYSISSVPDAVKEQMESLWGQELSEIGYIQVQPTFLYELSWNLVVLIVMIVFRKKRKFQGETLLWYLAGYGLGRFIIEGFRSDQLLIPVIGLPVSQVLSLILLIFSLAVIIIVRRKLRLKDVINASYESVENGKENVYVNDAKKAESRTKEDAYINRTTENTEPKIGGDAYINDTKGTESKSGEDACVNDTEETESKTKDDIGAADKKR